MDFIRPELSKLSALELEKLPYLTSLHSSICKYKAISTKLGYSLYNYKISDELIMDISRREYPELFALE